MFIEPVKAGTSLGALSHLVDMVLDAFSNPVNSVATVNKMKNFLEEVMKIHGKKMECAPPPDSSLKKTTLIFGMSLLVWTSLDSGVSLLVWNAKPGTFWLCTVKDISSLLEGSVEHITTAVPLSSIVVCKPDDMPCIEDWTTCYISYLFSGCRLHREPLDLNLVRIPGEERHSEEDQKFYVKKGFTRLSLVETVWFFLIFVETVWFWILAPPTCDFSFCPTPPKDSWFVPFAGCIWHWPHCWKGPCTCQYMFVLFPETCQIQFLPYIIFNSLLQTMYTNIDMPSVQTNKHTCA